MQREPCHLCNGTGFKIDEREVGQEMRKLRKAAGLSLKEMAERLGYSSPFLSDLELGRRHWGDKVDAFKTALKK